MKEKMFKAILGRKYILNKCCTDKGLPILCFFGEAYEVADSCVVKVFMSMLYFIINC